jgi:N-acetylglucosamine-6-phosphate deacetylase
MRTIIQNGTLITPRTMRDDAVIILNQGKIEAISTIITDETAQIIDAENGYVVPGFIDLHVHGAMGHDAIEGTPQSLYTLGEFFAKHGVTSYYPTTVANPVANIQAAMDNVARCPQPKNGAQHLGVHVEGPYLNAKYRGAQPEEYFRLPNPAEYQKWLESGSVKLVTIAPELQGAHEMMAALRPHGVEFAIGHSGASYEETLKAIDAGLRQITHTFNGIIPLHHREPGALAAAINDERVFAQIIADGVHVHPAMVKLLIRAKGFERTVLITDSMMGTGAADGSYEFAGMKVTVKQGIARIASGSLAGSTLTMDAAIRNVMQFAGVTLQQAVTMATLAPAQAMHIDDRKGQLAAGYDADIVILDKNLNVKSTIIHGDIVYTQPVTSR